MNYKELEKEFKKKDSRVSIRDLKKYKVNDIVEVYFTDSNGADESICAMPPEIRETKDPGYQDEYGRAHRCLEEVRAIVGGFIEKVNNSPEFLEEIMNKEV